jgi:hypothetical protein
MADGHVNKCKDCNKRDVIENRKSKVDYYREYDRVRGNRQSADNTRRYREENPKKYSAHCRVGSAIKTGRLVPAPCEVCGSTEVHGHHTDYDKPLDVMWLCSEHHVAWHAEHGEGANAH